MQKLGDEFQDLGEDIAALSVLKPIASIRDAINAGIEADKAKRADAIAAVRAFDADILDATEKRAEKEAAISWRCWRGAR
jgi:hypothetical protein